MERSFNWSTMDEEIIPLTFSPAFEKLFLENQNYLIRFLNAQTGLKIVPEKSEIHVGFEEVKKPLIHYQTNKFNFYITLNGEYMSGKDDFVRSKIALNPYLSVTFALYEDIEETIGDERIYQLIINYNPLDDKKGEFKVMFTDKDSGFSLNFYTGFIKNIEFYKHKYYDKKEDLDESKFWLLALNAGTYKELYELISHILSGDELDEFMCKIHEINSDENILKMWRDR